MFISKYEKEEMRISVRTLQAQMVHVLDELKALKASKAPKAPKAPKEKKPVFRTAEAPWGYKKDGTPRNRPGRPILAPTVVTEITNAKPLPV